ncbi:hypothetical protein EBR43_08780 [bacterium]|nr:hypothetical protein [bacterium]
MMANNIVSSTLSHGAFWMVNKKIAKILKSNDAALLLADLLSRREFFKNLLELDSEGGFYCLSEQIEFDLNLTKEMRQQVTKLLESFGFLKIKKKGLPSRNFYYIQDDKILEALGNDKKSNDSQWAEKDAQYRAEKDAANKNKENKNKTEREENFEKQEKPSVKAILSSWKAEIPPRPSFESRRSLLENLFETIRSYGHKEEDLPRKFKEDALSPWIGPKSKDIAVKLATDDYEIAMAVLTPVEIKSAPEKKVSKESQRTSQMNGEISLDAAISMTTEDATIESIMREFEKLRGDKDE